jgi:hypothetical protein
MGLARCAATKWPARSPSPPKVREIPCQQGKHREKIALGPATGPARSKKTHLGQILTHPFVRFPAARSRENFSLPAP